MFLITKVERWASWCSVIQKFHSTCNEDEQRRDTHSAELTPGFLFSCHGNICAFFTGKKSKHRADDVYKNQTNQQPIINITFCDKNSLSLLERASDATLMHFLSSFKISWASYDKISHAILFLFLESTRVIEKRPAPIEFPNAH